MTFDYIATGDSNVLRLDLDDIGADGMNLISEITEIYDIHGFETKVLAASIRSVQDIIDSAKLGADVATIPPKFLRAMYNHPLTDKGLADFLSDWKKTGQSIL
jgi:transaldolase